MLQFSLHIKFLLAFVNLLLIGWKIIFRGANKLTNEKWKIRKFYRGVHVIIVPA